MPKKGWTKLVVTRCEEMPIVGIAGDKMDLDKETRLKDCRYLLFGIVAELGVNFFE
jgi:hypothetical protein